MGQYHVIANLDRLEYLHPHRFADGLKLMEFGSSGDATMMALAILLAHDNGRGGGDFDSSEELVGSWAGCRIAICGDYGDPGVLVPDALAGQEFEGDDGKKQLGSHLNVYDLCSRGALRDVSDDVIRAVQQSSQAPWTDLQHINLAWKSEDAPSRFEQVHRGRNKADAAKVVG